PCPVPCVGLHGFNLPDSVADFASVNLINGYNGTVTFAADFSGGLSVAGFVLAAGSAGSIAQPVPGTDLSVLGYFAWSGGILNSTPSNANVNIYGGGNVALPGTGDSLTTGSTLNFSSLGGASITNITGAGNLILNGARP